MIMNLYQRHIFPRLLADVSKRFTEDRQRLAALLQGDVLELGSGTGESFPFYPAAVKRVVSLEYDDQLLGYQQPQRMPAHLANECLLLQGDGHQLPFQDAQFDQVFCCLVLCSVADPAQVLAEAYRVLKPGGALVVFEHVAAAHQLTHRAQRWLNPLWRPLACGCQLERQTGQRIREAGFCTDKLKRYRHSSYPALVGTFLEGLAIKPEKS